jgi:hypothetical protein
MYYNDELMMIQCSGARLLAKGGKFEGINFGGTLGCILVLKGSVSFGRLSPKAVLFSLLVMNKFNVLNIEEHNIGHLLYYCD